MQDRPVSSEEKTLEAINLHNKKIESTCYIITGTTSIREVNKALEWNLPTDGPKTLSGLILEYLESFPDGNAGLEIGDYRLEILELEGNVVQAVRAGVGGE